MLVTATALATVGVLTASPAAASPTTAGTVGSAMGSQGNATSISAPLPAAITLTSADGDPVPATWPLPLVDDDQDEAPDVACTPPSGRTFAVGSHTVTCTATDHAGNTDSGTFSVTVVERPAATAVSDRPVDPAPVMNIAKLGRSIPVKAALTSGGTPVTGPSSQPVHLSVSSAVDCAVTATGDAIKTYAAGSSNVGNLMRWDGARWVYNLDTSSFAMKPNACYRVSVHHGGTVADDRASGGVLAGSFYVQTRK